MIELPECYVLSGQIGSTLVGKIIKSAVANSSPHAFAWYTGDPAEYNGRLAGKEITSSNPGTGYTGAGNVEILCGNTLLALTTPIKYHAPGDKLPAKHQLLLEFDDGSHMSCTVQMWGAMHCYEVSEKPDRSGKAPDPLTDAFDEAYFNSLWDGAKPTLSSKAFLATEQRIPGLGNGVLQDILFNARIHPKTKLEKLSAEQRSKLYHSVKDTLLAMMLGGGRDTERDLFGCKGGYKTILSANTLDKPCPVCGGALVREAYLGGNIYYCPTCQPLMK